MNNILLDFSYKLKKFHSPNFSIVLKFSSQGALTGNLTHSIGECQCSTEFQGVYSANQFKLKLCFTITNPHLLTTTGYSGAIFNYSEEKQCLVLRFLEIQNSTTEGGNLVDDTAILFDQIIEEYSSEIKNVMDLISADTIYI